MQTTVPIVSRAEMRAITGREWSKRKLIECAALIGASELLGRPVDELHNRTHFTLEGGDKVYAMPTDRHRREVRAGAELLIEKVSKRYVYMRTL